MTDILAEGRMDGPPCDYRVSRGGLDETDETDRGRSLGAPVPSNRLQRFVRRHPWSSRLGSAKNCNGRLGFESATIKFLAEQ